jgi:hypothetical protein
VCACLYLLGDGLAGGALAEVALADDGGECHLGVGGVALRHVLGRGGLVSVKVVRGRKARKGGSEKVRKETEEGEGRG